MLFGTDEDFDDDAEIDFLEKRLRMEGVQEGKHEELFFW